MNKEVYDGYSEKLEEVPVNTFMKDLYYIATATSGGTFPDQRNEVKLLREFYSGQEEVHLSKNDDTVQNR